MANVGSINRVISAPPPNLKAVIPISSVVKIKSNPINLNPASFKVNMNVNGMTNHFALNSAISNNVFPAFGSSTKQSIKSFNNLPKKPKQKIIKKKSEKTVPLNPSSFNPKKSKLNANAASYKPMKVSTSVSPKKSQQKQPAFKMPKIGNNTNNNLKSFDFRNLGSLIADNDILNRDHKDYDYDFGAALNESHLDLHSTNSELVKAKKVSIKKEKEQQKIVSVHHDDDYKEYPHDEKD